MPENKNTNENYQIMPPSVDNATTMNRLTKMTAYGLNSFRSITIFQIKMIKKIRHKKISASTDFLGRANVSKLGIAISC